MDTLDEHKTNLRCGLPAAREAIGERWSFLILRAAYNGIQHFEEFLTTLGIALNILSDRLGRLVDSGIMVREPCANDRRKIEYRLTEKGIDLLPAILALRQWGEKYGSGGSSNPVLVDTRDFRPIATIAIRAHDVRHIGWSELEWQDEALSASPPGGRPHGRDFLKLICVRTDKKESICADMMSSDGS